MKKLLEKWCSFSLVLKIAAGLVLGAILGIAVPQFTILSWLGDLFVSALRAVAPVLVFVLVMSSLANSKGGAGANMRTVIVLYVASTLIAAFVATGASLLFPQTMELADAATSATAPHGVLEVIENLLLNMVANPVGAIVNGNYIGILTWATILGVALKNASDVTKKLLVDVSGAVNQAVQWIINLAPFGIMGLVFSTVSEKGLYIFTGYGKLLVLLVGFIIGVIQDSVETALNSSSDVLMTALTEYYLRRKADKKAQK